MFALSFFFFWINTPNYFPCTSYVRFAVSFPILVEKCNRYLLRHVLRSGVARDSDAFWCSGDDDDYSFLCMQPLGLRHSFGVLVFERKKKKRGEVLQLRPKPLSSY